MLKVMTMRAAIAGLVFSGLAAIGPGGVAAGQVVILPGTVNTGISAISDDGTRVAGTRTGLGAFFWDQVSDYRYLTHPRWVGTPVYLSGDGHTIATLSGEFSTQQQTFIESDTGEVSVLPISVPGFVNQSNPTGVSRDGSVVSGWDGHTSNGNQVGWRWSATGGMQLLPGFSYTLSMSGDGRTIFGGNGSGSYGMWRDGVVSAVPGHLGRVQAVNYDGSIFAGDGRIWNNGQIIDMPLLPGGASSDILDLSEDGSVVVGKSYMGSGVYAPFIWTPSTGTQPLGAYFASDGYDLSAYRITVVHVSADGRTFGMQGQSTIDNSIRGIIITVPGPPTVVLLAGLGLGNRRRR